MSKESTTVGLHVRFHSAPSESRSEREERPRSARPFTPEFLDLERLLPRLRERQRRLRSSYPKRGIPMFRGSRSPSSDVEGSTHSDE